MKKTHVILVNPSFIFSDIKKMRHMKYNDFPLNLALLGSVLISKGYTAEIVNANIHPDWQDRIIEILYDRDDVAFVGFTCMSSQVEPALKVCQEIKSKFDVKIVFGGVHPTLLPESILKTKYVDICVVGEGDTAIDKIVEWANYQRPEKELTNTVSCNGRTPAAPLTSFKSLPRMMHESLYADDIEKYIVHYSENGKEYRGFPLLTGLGCNYQCAFCINHITKRRYRAKSAEALQKEMRFLRKKYGIDFFIFQDEHFFGDRARLFELLQYLENDLLLRGIRWTTTVRVTDIKDDYISVEVMKRLKRCGCVGLGTGGESGSDRVLKTIRKGSQRKDIVRAAKYANESKLPLNFSFVMLWPGETAEDMVQTAQVIDEVCRTGQYSNVPYFQTYRPYPGSTWEPDLSRFEDPYNIPRDIWRMRLGDRDQLKSFPDPKFVYRLIITAQVLALSSPVIRFSWNPVELLKSIVSKSMFTISSFRIRHALMSFQIERMIQRYILSKYAQF